MRLKEQPRGSGTNSSPGNDDSDARDKLNAAGARLYVQYSTMEPTNVGTLS